MLLALFLFNPTKTLRHEARFWTLRVMSRIFCAPFFYVSFADFWIADQLNSLHTVFLDFQYFVCFYFQNSSWTDVTGEYNLYYYLYRNKTGHIINISWHFWVICSVIFYYYITFIIYIFNRYSIKCFNCSIWIIIFNKYISIYFISTCFNKKSCI